MFLSLFLNQKFLLGLICLFFLLTRLYKITEIPPSLYWDEASIGYNAYSILKTGEDEWGESFPLHFRAFGEFKLPVYIYSVVPFVALFGLNEFSVRIPAVLFSLGVVILAYLLVKKIFDNETAGTMAAFFITISPWFFIFSRTGYEATAGLMFYLLGIYLFLNVNKNVQTLILCTISFILSMYSYNSFRVITPLTILILILILLERRQITSMFIKSMHITLLSLVLLMIALLPIYRLYVYDAGVSRFQAVGGIDAEMFLKNYLSHFNVDFLFLNGDKNLRSHVPGAGQLFLFDLILLPLGLLYLLRIKSKYRFLPILLLLIAPIPAAITKESPHALRAISMVPFIAMLSAMGIANIKKYLPQKYFVELVTLVIFLSFFFNYFKSFVTVYPNESSDAWQYGYKKIFTDPKFRLVTTDRILISDRDGQPYIFALFYLKYDPEKFRAEVVRSSVDKWGFSTVKSFGRFEFGE